MRLWNDAASYALYEFAFKEMCNTGRCFSYALVGQKFYEDNVEAVYDCWGSRPQPFTLPLTAIVHMKEEAPSESFNTFTMSLDSYLTYQYMWSLDERNVKRGILKLVRSPNEDIVLETLNELRDWQNLPEDQKWREPRIVMMFSFEDIRRSHSVLAYRVEELGSNRARVWVIDSNRPFQPNSANNQNGSYIEFTCCSPDGRWEFEFKHPDGTVIRDFLFSTPTTLFHGESSAITEWDVLEGIVEASLETVISLWRSMGYSVNVSVENGTITASSQQSPTSVTLVHTPSCFSPSITILLPSSFISSIQGLCSSFKLSTFSGSNAKRFNSSLLSTT